ncbi:MAG: transcriptional accessory protein Tex [Planctomycetaceae bacterium]|nr:transcriptional accessory protein Tex [Planctomycetaceae bacterium]
MEPTLENAKLELVARQVRLPLEKIQATVELLDEGNTVPFITRYRRDRTGGLDEEQIRQVQEAVLLQRQLDERRQKILRSIDSQSKLTEELEQQIRAANSLKNLEDLYLPFRPKKQSLATVAKQRGLEPLAVEILQASGEVEDLESRAAAFVDSEKELNSTADVLTGVGHILAEMISERVDLRALARKGMWTGTLVSKRIENAQQADGELPVEEKSLEQLDQPADDTGSEDPTAIVEDESPADERGSESQSDEPVVAAEENSETATEETATEETATEETATEETAAAADNGSSPQPPAHEGPAKPGKAEAAEERRVQRRESRRRKRQKLEQSFKDYFDYSEPISRLPHYRVLAINRGERCKVLRVKIQFDNEQLRNDAEQLIVETEHPYAATIRDALHDALHRLVVPSIEREIRRDLTDRAELHAVKVFAQNLRKLLLQPPLHQHRVLAIDPGFRSGCKLVGLDEFGNVLSHTLIHVIGAAERVQQSRQRLIEQIKEHQVSVVAIGNGTASRETEQLVAQILTDELADSDVKYLMVNEAGASVYSTSQMGREELPKFDATVRGAVSIGRRALDPLSELVKIDPANIGVGLYQHDIKAKHLRDSLDAVVESCVNYVGVDVNSASPALLGYVSGLNQLTARRLYEYRQEHGPFRNREQLKEVAGIGDATFVQAAGFLKIPGAENPLDETWIHPESYEIAERVLGEIDCDVAELVSRKTQPLESSQQASAESSSEVAVEDASTATSTDATSTDATSTDSEAAASVATEADVQQAESPAAKSDSTSEADATTAVESSADDDAASDGTAEAGAAANQDVSANNGLAERLMGINTVELAEKLTVGKLLLADILSSLARPGRDPREDLSPPVFRREILKLEDLKQGMKFSGTVLNVVDFGAFVDIGLTDSGLIHVSRLADRFISDPHDVVSVGDILEVWVIGVDDKRRRVSLTAIEPGTEKPRQQRPKKSEAKEGSAPRRRKPTRSKESGEKRRGQQGARGKGARQKTNWKPKKKAKPVAPITDAMAEGREPMRTFSDLLQFHQRKSDTDKPDSEGNQKNS